MATPVTSSDEDRILTIPNVITFVRLLCLPVYLWLLLGLDNRAAAAGLLADAHPEAAYLLAQRLGTPDATH